MKPWPDPDDNTPSERALRIAAVLYAVLIALSIALQYLFAG